MKKAKNKETTANKMYKAYKYTSCTEPLVVSFSIIYNTKFPIIKKKRKNEVNPESSGLIYSLSLFFFLRFFRFSFENGLNPLYALELRNEDLNSNKSGSFIGFSIAPLWLNQKTQRSF